ncbi:MAG TPA: molecular chaperone TorD family protein [Gemmataceae bacterium]|nr:molecular chaperone TorD family protein [Gemmataceae bacterium]
MSSTVLTPEAQAIDLARECLYRFLAAALHPPGSKGWQLAADPESQRLASAAAELLREEALQRPAAPGFGELTADRLDLRPLLEELRRPAEELAAEYQRVFGLVFTGECPPYETEYQPNADPFFRAQQMADIAGFYRAFGLEPGRSLAERSDHLALELEFLALLLAKKRLALAEDADGINRAAVCDEAFRAFFRDHVAWWVPSFALGLRRKTSNGLYAALAQFLAALLPTERGRLGVAAPRLPLQAALIERPEEQESCAGCAAGP